MGGKQKPPPTPDYAAAAQAQGQANLQAGQQTAALNRPDQYTPDGSQTWALKPGADPKNPQAGDWIVTTKLNDTQQALKNQQDSLSAQYGNLSQGAMHNVAQTMNQPFNPNLPQTQQVSMDGLRDARYSTAIPELQKMQGPEKQARAEEMGQMQYMQGPKDAAYSYVGAQNERDFASVGVNDKRAEITNAGLRDFGTVAGSTEESRKRITDAMYARQEAMLNPRWKQLDSDLTSRLAAQGLSEGSEAYNRATDQQRRQQEEAYAAARNDAILAGGAEESRIGGMNLNAAMFQNSTRAQEFGERQTIADFANKNIDSKFSQQIASANLLNQNKMNAFQQQLQASQANNTTTNGIWDRGLAAADMNNKTSMGAYDRYLAQQGFNNDASSKDFTQNGMALDYNNTLLQKKYDMENTNAAFDNNVRAQGLAERTNLAGFNNSVRDRQYAEALAARQNVMNEANALRNGAQIAPPTFQAYGGAGTIGAAPILDATNQQYQSQLAGVNAVNQNNAGMWQGIVGAAQAAATAY